MSQKNKCVFRVTEGAIKKGRSVGISFLLLCFTDKLILLSVNKFAKCFSTIYPYLLNDLKKVLRNVAFAVFKENIWCHKMNCNFCNSAFGQNNICVFRVIKGAAVGPVGRNFFSIFSRNYSKWSDGKTKEKIVKEYKDL